MTVGGAFKPEKCFACITSYGWRQHGNWFHEANESLPEIKLSVPLPGGRQETIEHTSAQTAKEILGVFSCHSGACRLSVTRPATGWRAPRRGTQADRTFGSC